MDYRRSSRGKRVLSAIGATLLVPLLAANPAGAVTTPVTAAEPGDWTETSGSCGGTTTATHAYEEGPATPPSGTGSHELAVGTNGNSFPTLRLNEFDGTPIEDIDTLTYATYVDSGSGQQAPYFIIYVDKTGDGVQDEQLVFEPFYQSTTYNNADQGPIVLDTWQVWDVANGGSYVNLGGSPTPNFTLAEYAAANPGATIATSVASGSIRIAAGCGAGAWDNFVGNIDEVIIDVADMPVQKYDFEATAPARTLTIDPKSGPAGTKITVTGTDCFESTATARLGESSGQSGDELASVTATPAANGTWSATLTVPSGANPDFTQSVLATCGPDADPAFDYTGQAFDVTGPSFPTGSNGYRMVAADGGIFTFGAREFHGSTGNLVLNKPIVGGATDKGTYNGYWIVASDGGVFTFNAPFYGSLGDQTLASPATEIEPTPTGKGYYIVLANGKVHTFGDAAHFGDMAGKPLNKPIIGMSVTPTGKGYWLVGEDGGIFNFGDAGFFGSTGNLKLNAPVIDLAPAVDNNGYYLLAKDGGVFTFGSADFKGSTGDMKLNAPVIAMLTTPSGNGYWLAATDGGIFSFGAGADFLGSMGGTKLNSPVLDLIN
jgi:hypothetical protein